MKKIVELRGYERRNGDLHLFATFDDGSYKEIKPAEVVDIINEHFEKNAQLDITTLHAPRKAG